MVSKIDLRDFNQFRFKTDFSLNQGQGSIFTLMGMREIDFSHDFTPKNDFPPKLKIRDWREIKIQNQFQKSPTSNAIISTTITIQNLL